MSQPTPVLVIKDLNQIKVLADPLRQRLLGAFAGEPRTTKQVAEALDLPATRLYRHVEILEQAGFLFLVRTAQKRGTVEKYYQAVAKKITIAPNSLGQGKSSAIEEMFEAAFQDALDGIRAIPPNETSQEKSAVLATGLLRISPEQLDEFQAKIAEICETFSKPSDEPRKTYRMIFTLCPSSIEEEQGGEKA